MNVSVTDNMDTDMGTIQIAPEVIEVIAGLATIEVEGIAGMSGGFVGDIAEMLGRKNLSKGVKVEVGQKEAAIDVSVIVEFGRAIPELASSVQRNVKHAIESMTGLHVIEVNINVHDVLFKATDIVEEDNTSVSSRVK